MIIMHVESSGTAGGWMLKENWEMGKFFMQVAMSNGSVLVEEIQAHGTNWVRYY